MHWQANRRPRSAILNSQSPPNPTKNHCITIWVISTCARWTLGQPLQRYSPVASISTRAPRSNWVLESLPTGSGVSRMQWTTSCAPPNWHRTWNSRTFFLGRLLQHASHRIEEVTERMRIFNQRNSKSHLGPFLYGQALLSSLGTRNDPEAIETAEALLRESIKRNADFWESHYELGTLLEKKRELQSAETHLELAVKLNPEASKPHYRLARVYQRLGRAKDAKRERELHKRIAERGTSTHAQRIPSRPRTVTLAGSPLHSTGRTNRQLL